MKNSRNDIVKFCEEYLSVGDFEDYCNNGLQVEGASEVKKIVTGVSLSQKLIEAAIGENADMIMVHHGFFNDQIAPPVRIDGLVKNRLKLILENNINIVGFHLPLDAHDKIGNNISICKILGIKNTEKCNVGFVGELDSEIDFDKFLALVDSELETKSFYINSGNKRVKRVGVISGGSSPEFNEAVAMGADTYIAGDIREHIVRAVEETGINFINAGHYNTEKIGVQNLGELVAKKFGVEVKFVDVPNEV
jgi:dinuclear metal center YbgI/SA1388 family protein